MIYFLILIFFVWFLFKTEIEFVRLSSRKNRIWKITFKLLLKISFKEALFLWFQIGLDFPSV